MVCVGVNGGRKRREKKVVGLVGEDDGGKDWVY